MALYEQYGSEGLAVKIIRAGRNSSVAEVPETDDWTAWNADHTRSGGACASQRGATAKRAGCATVSGMSSGADGTNATAPQ